MAAKLTSDRHEFNIDKNGIIVSALQTELTDNFKTPVNLKKFYSDMAEVLLFNYKGRFLDCLGRKHEKEVGIFFDHQAPTSVEPTANDLGQYRTGNIFEDHFVWTNYKDGTNEVETNWNFRCPTKHSPYGWFEFTLNLVARVIVEKKVKVGDKTETQLDAMWEFRNKVYYKNNIYTQYLSKLTIVKDSPSLMRLYIDHVYYKQILKDIEYCQDILKPMIYKVIAKHFQARVELAQ